MLAGTLSMRASAGGNGSHGYEIRNYESKNIVDSTSRMIRYSSLLTQHGKYRSE